MADAKLVVRGFSEDIMEDTITGQTEPVPIEHRDYLLQMIVSLEEETVNPNTDARKYKVKKSGALKLTRIPMGTDIGLGDSKNG